jgi:hypothetical protein
MPASHAELSPALLEDLLDASARLYHRHVAIIQRVFHDQWLDTVRDQVSREPVVIQGETPAQIETRVRDRLILYRQELRRRQASLIAEEREKRANRDQAIRTYVSSLSSPGQAA